MSRGATAGKSNISMSIRQYNNPVKKNLYGRFHDLIWEFESRSIPDTLVYGWLLGKVGLGRPSTPLRELAYAGAESKRKRIGGNHPTINFAFHFANIYFIEYSIGYGIVVPGVTDAGDTCLGRFFGLLVCTAALHSTPAGGQYLNVAIMRPRGPGGEEEKGAGKLKKKGRLVC